MIDYKTFYKIPFFNGKKIVDIITLSNSFGAFCGKIKLADNKQFVIKKLIANDNYDHVLYEGKCLEFMHNKFPKLFPQIFCLMKNVIIMEYINHNNVKNKHSENDFAYQLSLIHKIKNEQFGFDFDPPIGGLRQPSNFENSWVDFYGNKRLGMIFEIINSTNPMPNEVNKGIENILKNLKNLIPNSPKPSLIHGDLWDGNILFNDGKLVGLIDLGIYYAHHEMEIAYLEWFEYISNNFYKYYSEYHELNKDYFDYSKVYQLYYSLLNVHLWSRSYIKNTFEIVKKYS